MKGFFGLGDKFHHFTMSTCFVFLPLNDERLQDDAISRRTSIEWCDSKGSDWHDSIQEARLIFFLNVM